MANTENAQIKEKTPSGESVDPILADVNKAVKIHKGNMEVMDWFTKEINKAIKE